MVAIMGEAVVLVAVKAGIFPEPLAARPMAGLLFVHVNVVPETGPDKVVVTAASPLQKTWVLILLTVGVGLTVTV